VFGENYDGSKNAFHWVFAFAFNKKYNYKRRVRRRAKKNIRRLDIEQILSALLCSQHLNYFSRTRKLVGQKCLETK
jgi:hypothetical protein